jgi:hypothetical protein
MKRLDALLTWLKDPNTIKLLVTLAGISGVALDPTLISQIILGILAARDLVNVASKDKLTNPTPPAELPK